MLFTEITNGTKDEATQDYFPVTFTLPEWSL